jgi:hypothetical protein
LNLADLPLLILHLVLKVLYVWIKLFFSFVKIHSMYTSYNI